MKKFVVADFDKHSPFITVGIPNLRIITVGKAFQQKKVNENPKKLCYSSSILVLLRYEHFGK